MKIEDLKPADYNPRKITDKAAAGLRASIERFGDLSGIVWNRRTGNLVAGHQRVDQLKKVGARFVSTMDGPPRFLLAGKEFNIRVVDWDSQTEKAANIAANSPAIAGEFTDGLGDVLAELESFDGWDELRLGELDIPRVDEPVEIDPDAPSVAPAKKTTVECPECRHKFELGG